MSIVRHCLDQLKMNAGVLSFLSVNKVYLSAGIILGMPRFAPASPGFAWLINRLNYYCYKYGYEEFEMFIYTVLLYHVM